MAARESSNTVIVVVEGSQINKVVDQTVRLECMKDHLTEGINQGTASSVLSEA